MSVDKLVDSSQLDSDLASVANAIRTKCGTSASIAFPSGFVSSINGITTGVDFIKGNFTVGNSETSHVLSFGKTFSKYLFIIEADDDSKSAIMETGMSYNRAYMFIGTYPGIKITSDSIRYQTIVERVKPSNNVLALDNAGLSTYTLSGSSITIPCSALSNTNAPSFLYQGLTYNYHVFEIV